MTGFADKERLRGNGPDTPADEVASPPIAPEAQATLAPSDDKPPTSQAPGSSTPPNLLDRATNFNDTISSQIGDISQSGFAEAGKVSASPAPNTSELAAAQNELLAVINAGQFSGATLGHAQAMLSDLTAAISAANVSAGSGGMPGPEPAISASHLNILNTVATDPLLANSAAQNAAKEPAAQPAASPAAKTTAAAPEENPTQSADTATAAQVAEDTVAVTADMEMQALMAADPELFSGLTGDDADAIAQKMEAELAHINATQLSPGAAQVAGDDIIAIIESDTDPAIMIVQGQSNLPGQQPVAGLDTQDSSQVTIITINDESITIAAEASAIVVDYGVVDPPQPANHLHDIWG